jgi:hypothetical protein
MLARWVILTALGLVLVSVPGACTMFGVRTSEEALHDVLEREGNVEIREYRSHLVAEVEGEGDYSKAGGDAFGPLFRFISGDNAGATKIAMTVPVLQEEVVPGNDDASSRDDSTSSDDEERASRTDPRWKLGFVLPSAFTSENVPRPEDPRVSITESPERRVAVICYSGSRSEEVFREKAEELGRWIRDHGYRAVSIPRSAAYDPPWTLPFLRRNEVLIDVEPAGKGS